MGGFIGRAGLLERRVYYFDMAKEWALLYFQPLFRSSVVGSFLCATTQITKNIFNLKLFYIPVQHFIKIGTFYQK